VLSDLIQSTQLFPDEDQTTYDALREMLFSDLTSGTPYEHVIAQNLVDLEWEAMRHRRFRDQLILSEYRDAAAELVDKSDRPSGFSMGPSQADKALALNSVSSDPEMLRLRSSNSQTATSLLQKYWLNHIRDGQKS
jgi:hypothetical protein